MLIFSSITCSHGVFVDLAHHKKWRVKTDKIFCITQPPHLQHGGWQGLQTGGHHNDILSIDQTLDLSHLITELLSPNSGLPRTLPSLGGRFSEC